jgi:hypothetical protein
VKDTISDVFKTLFPNGVVLGFVHSANLKDNMEVLLLALSIFYTAIRIAMLFFRPHAEDENDE